VLRESALALRADKSIRHSGVFDSRIVVRGAQPHPIITHFWNVAPPCETVFLDEFSPRAFHNYRILYLKIVFTELTNNP
jgi:hypothetical protein